MAFNFKSNRTHSPKIGAASILDNGTMRYLARTYLKILVLQFLHIRYNVLSVGRCMWHKPVAWSGFEKD